MLDVPHQWSGWTKRALVGADDILIVAEPDLANLRNTKNMLSMLKAARPNDRPPLYCLNQVGMPKRPEIDARGFAKTIESQPIASIPFDSRLFGTAANNGQMIAEISARHRTTEMFLQIARRLTGRSEAKKPRARSCRRSSGSCGPGRPGAERRGLREPDARGKRRPARVSPAVNWTPIAATAFVGIRACMLLPGQQSLEIGDIRRRLLGRPIGLHDAFRLGETALQPDHQRQIQPHPRIRIRAAIGAAQDLLRLGQIL